MWTWRIVLPGLGLAVCGYVLWQSSRTEAQRPSPVATTARADSGRGRVVAEGRVVARPGAEVTVGSESGGTIASVLAIEKAEVRKGDLLVDFRADDLQLALTEAEARLGEADADLFFYQAEHQKKVKAKTSGTEQEREFEVSRHDVQVAVARRKVAEVAVGRARLALSRARVTTPIDGVVIAVDVRAGEVVPPGSRLVTVCDLNRLRIEAEVDEFDVDRIKQGAEVIVKVEGSEETWRGTVEEIPNRVAIRTLQPGDPGRPSDTRVLLVKIAIERKLSMKLGQQVEVEIRVPESTIEQGRTHLPHGLDTSIRR
jgi:RND family efflux transporter MFP subunit